jgi:MFS family permease
VGNPVLRALRQRDFAILLGGQSVSFLGDGIFNVALAWQALRLPSGAAALGTVFLVRSLTRVAILLVGGALADRYQKRLLILTGDLLQMLAVGALAYVAATGDVQLWQLSVVAAVTGLGSGIFLSSSSALVPEIVETGSLESANSLRSSAQQVMLDFLGPALGGVLVAAAGTAAAFAVDALTFLASIVALLFIRPRRTVEAVGPSTLFKEVREGVGYVARTPWIWVSLIAVGTVGNFASFGPLNVLIPLLVREHLQAGAGALGLVFASYGVGGFLAAIAVGSGRIRTTTPVPAYMGWMAGAIGLGCLAFVPNAVVAGAVLVVVGFGGQIGNIVWETLLQKLVPARLLGRVVSIDWLVSLSLQPLGIALAAPVAAWLGVPLTFIAGAALTTSTMSVGLSLRSVRHPEEAAATP